MSGQVEYRKPGTHVCTPGVVKIRRGPLVHAYANEGDDWVCDDCSSIWTMKDGSWARTLLTRRRW